MVDPMRHALRRARLMRAMNRHRLGRVDETEKRQFVASSGNSVL